MARRKPTAQQVRQLTEQFRALGAFDPESWAQSQLHEGIPQYARFVFLRQMWKNAVAEGDTTWMDRVLEATRQRPRDPAAGAGPALERMLAAGASRQDVAEVVRVMQWHLLEGLAYALDDPGVVEYPSEEFPRVNWALFEVEEDGEPLHVIDGLHESVLDTDPSGREMRPKGVDREG
jgi:hypothetical protein